MNDEAIFAALIDAMEAEHTRMLGPQEIREFLPPVKTGNGLLLLLRHAVDKNTSRNDTSYLLDPVQDCLGIHDVTYYLTLLHIALTKLRLTQEELEALYLRHEEVVLEHERNHGILDRVTQTRVVT